MKTKKKLPVINNNFVVKNYTCFSIYEHYNVPCDKVDCKNWIAHQKELNCILIASKKPNTLNDIGNIFGLTRMRICQIEKNIKKKIFNLLKKNVTKDSKFYS